jgi:arginyl-tRNA synthetase
MNIFSHFAQLLKSAVRKLYNIEIENFAVELPREKGHGDMSTNIAMVLKGRIEGSPKEIAEKIAQEFGQNSEIDEVAVAGPGFINFKINNNFFHDTLRSLSENPGNFFTSKIGNGKAVNVEYVSCNPTGPMHVGHMRQAVFGDALARLLAACNYKVTKEFYINDAGGQIITVVDTVFERYKEALKVPFAIKEGMYPGEYLIPVGEGLKDQYGDSLLACSESERFAKIRAYAVAYMLKTIKADLQSLGVEHDLFFSEKEELHDTNMVAQSIEFLQNKGLIYRGILEPPKGKTPEDYEPREQTLFKATAFGDEIDRPLVKSDGSYAYFAADIAYHKSKIDRGFNDMVLVLGADHGGYVKRIMAAVKALSDNQAQIDVKIVQMVSLIKDDKVVKMSKRSGSYVTLAEVVEEVGKDVARFVMLTRKNDTALEFNFNKVVEQSKENPVFYVHYASARINSLFKTAAERGVDLKGANYYLLTHEKDLELIKALCQYNKILEQAAVAHEPHRITYYLIELANLFHGYWSLGNSDESLRFFTADPELSKARLALCNAIKIVIYAGLDILGIKPMEKM